MAGPLKVLQVPVPTLGIDQDGAPQSLDRARAPYLINFLPGQNGKIRQRGPTGDALDSNTVLERQPSGILPSQPTNGAGGLFIAFRNNSAAATIEPWVQRVVRSSTVASLAQGSASAAVYQNYSNLTTAVTAALTRVTTPGPRWDRWNNQLRICGYDSPDNVDNAGGDPTAANTVLLQDGARYRLTQLLVYDLTAPATPPTAMGTAQPFGSVAIREFTGREFLAGGLLRNVGTGANTRLFTNHLWFSNPWATRVGTYADWLDPVTAQNNTLLVGSDNVEEAIIGLARQGRTLVVFKRHSTHLVSGAGPATYSVRMLAPDIGCIDPGSIVEVSDVVLWLSAHGFMMYDGANITNISAGIATTAVALALATNETVYGAGGAGQLAGHLVTGVANDHENVLFSLAKEYFNPPGPAQSTQNYGLFMYNIRQRNWVEMTVDKNYGSPPWYQAVGPTRLVRGADPNYVWGWGRDALVSPFYKTARIDKWTQPDNSNWAAYTGTDGTAVINTRWVSNVLTLAAPPYKAVIKRLLIQANMQPSVDPKGWYVSITDRKGSAVFAEVQIPKQTSRYNGGQIYALDIMREADEVQVEIRYFGATGTVGQPSYAEIYGVWLEYAAAQEPHS